MKQVNPYLNFDGNTEVAFNFYKSVFGGSFNDATFVRMKDMPQNGEHQLTNEELNRIMHVSLPLDNGQVLMGSDILPSMGQKLQVGNNNQISIFTESREEADRLFSGLSQGGKVEMPMSDQFWGDYFGSCEDKFGIHWMINFQV